MDDYIRAHASGFVHVRLLLENIHYVAGIAPATFISDRKAAERLGRLSVINPTFHDVSFNRKREIAFILSQYLRGEYDRHCAESPIFANQAVGSRLAMRMIRGCLDRDSTVIGAHLDPTLL